MRLDGMTLLSKLALIHNIGLVIQPSREQIFEDFALLSITFREEMSWTIF